VVELMVGMLPDKIKAVQQNCRPLLSPSPLEM
jgi:hypothetical protein